MDQSAMSAKMDQSAMSAKMDQSAMSQGRTYFLSFWEKYFEKGESVHSEKSFSKKKIKYTGH